MIIGLTGGIASGKSTVSSMLKKRGYPIVDADIIARQVVEPGEVAYKKLVSVFGDDIVQEDLHINRKKLGSIIFKDNEKRKKLNNIVHPAVRAKMKLEVNEYIDKGYETVIMDIPLLIESNLTYMVDKILLVYVGEETQLKRLMERDQSNIEEAMERINAQMSMEEKKRFAHEIINNEGSLEETETQLEEILKKWHIN
ncbi:dephospho-CoA kinase [Evansella sp. AB-P1]|uniref:dephospho-CoA kinase n=1 Tax=Evansella sp. AB-P1 TaxID=3037653 RepID=UPI00241D5543|nr:dephospho-CoA kinase [Evansella sp. AB-P1]MDG5786967.1 dephospho-CoA kinase [Evansella sp. AB-P1]